MNDNLIMLVKFEPKTTKTTTVAQEDLIRRIIDYHQSEPPLFYTVTEGSFTFAEVLTEDDLPF